MREDYEQLVRECSSMCDRDVDYDEIDDTFEYLRSMSDEEYKIFAFIIASTAKFYREGFLAVAHDISKCTTDDEIEKLVPKMDTMSLLVSMFDYLLQFLADDKDEMNAEWKKLGLPSSRERAFEIARKEYEKYMGSQMPHA